MRGEKERVIRRWVISTPFWMSVTPNVNHLVSSWKEVGMNEAEYKKKRRKKDWIERSPSIPEWWLFCFKYYYSRVAECFGAPTHVPNNPKIDNYRHREEVERRKKKMAKREGRFISNRWGMFVVFHMNYFNSSIAAWPLYSAAEQWIFSCSKSFRVYFELWLCGDGETENWSVSCMLKLSERSGRRLF